MNEKKRQIETGMFFEKKEAFDLFQSCTQEKATATWQTEKLEYLANCRERMVEEKRGGESE